MLTPSSTVAVRHAEQVLRDIRSLEDLASTQDSTIRSLAAQKGYVKTCLDQANARLEASVEEVTALRLKIKRKLLEVENMPTSKVMAAATVAMLLEEILEQ